MGLTFKLGTIPLAIQTDASNNVGIGAAPSGSYKLEVTGTGRFTSIIYGSNGNLDPTAGTNAGTTLALNGNSVANNYSIGLGAIRNSAYDMWFQTGATNGGGYRWYIGTSEKMTISNTGNVVINTSNSTTLRFTVGEIFTAHSMPALGSLGGLFGFFNTDTAGGPLKYGLVGDVSGVTGAVSLQSQRVDGTATAYSLNLQPNGGAVLINTTTQDSGAKLTLNHAGSIGASFISTGTAAQGVIYFKNGNGLVGQIYTDGSSTVYATSSDYRLKQDFKDFNGLDLVSSIKTYDYEWKSNKKRAFGLLAHELKEIIPYAVVGEKDALNEDGSINPQGVDYSMLVPMLVKAIQELNERLNKAGL
jgi:hypothetical protein